MLIVQCGSAVAAALTEWLWLGTRLSPAQAALAALTLAGVVIGLAASRHRTPLRPCRRAPPGFTWGVVLAVISAVAQGGGAVLSRKAFAVLHARGFFMDGATSAYQRVLGGLAVGTLALAGRAPLAGGGSTDERRRSGPVPATALPPWTWVLLNTLLGPVLGVTCYQWALRGTPGRRRPADRGHRAPAHGAHRPGARAQPAHAALLARRRARGGRGRGSGGRAMNLAPP